MYHSQVPVTCTGHEDPVVQLDFSKVCSSGYYLASACLDGVPMLRHGDTGDWVGSFEGHSAAVWGVALNDEATLLATASEDHTARIWNAETGEERQQFKHHRDVRCVAFDEQAQLLATGCKDNGMAIYSLQQDQLQPTLIGEQTRDVRDVLFCRDDRALLSSSHDRSIRLWDRLSQKQSHCIVLPHHAKSLELCADKQTVTIAYAENVIFVNVDTFVVLEQHKLPVHLLAASLHPDKQSFVCAGVDRRIYKCDYASGEIIDAFKAHNSTMRSIKYSPDGEVFASSADDGTVRLWQQTVGKKYGLWRMSSGSEDTQSGEEPPEGSESDE